MAITLQPNVILVDDIRSFPEAVVLTGTVVSLVLQITGTATDFFNELLMNPDSPNNAPTLKYKYIFNPATGEIREIDFIQSATTLRLKTAFSVEMAGEDFSVINNYFYNSITINPQGAGVLFYSVGSESTALDANATEMLESEIGLNPIAIDATASDAIVTTS